MKRLITFTILLFLTVLSSAADVELLPLLDRVDATLEWDPFRRTGVIVKGGKRVSFKEDVPFALVDYRVRIPFAVSTISGGVLVLSEKSAGALSSLLATEKTTRSDYRIGYIVIDPGHGGQDPGTNHVHKIDGRTVTIVEKDVVLKIARALHALLGERFPDKNIILTRDEDVYLRLEDRVEIANRLPLDDSRHEAMIFVSIHVNAALSPKPFGYEVWHIPMEYQRDNLIEAGAYEEDSPHLLPILNALLDEEYTIESVLLGREILNGMDASLGGASENRGLREEAWFVVRNAKMPSVLVEVGYATNPEEALRMNDDAHLMQMASGIYNGITRFVESYESSNGFTE